MPKLPYEGSSQPRPYTLTIDGRRTSLRLEPEFWEAAHKAATAEGITIGAFCAAAIAAAPLNRNRSAAIRVAVLGYWMAAAARPRRRAPAPAV